MKRIPFLSTPAKERLSCEEIENNKKVFLELLRSVKRKGIDEIAKHLEANGFFMQKSHSHHNYEGGTAEHSLGVYRVAMKFGGNCPKDSVTICSLLHDIGRGGGGEEVRMLASWGLELKPEEWRAIRFHMGCCSRKTTLGDKVEFQKAKTEKLWHLLHSSDVIDAGGYDSTIIQMVIRTIITLLKV